MIFTKVRVKFKSIHSIDPLSSYKRFHKSTAERIMRGY